MDGLCNPFLFVKNSKIKMDYSRHPWRSPSAAFGVRSGILPPQSGSPLHGVRNDDKI
jgi:hypothetical protein